MKHVRSRRWDYLAIDEPQYQKGTATVRNFVRCQHCGWVVDKTRQDSTRNVQTFSLVSQGTVNKVMDPTVIYGCPQCGSPSFEEKV